MPVSIRKIGRGKYRVSTPGGVKAKSTSKSNALKQARLLRAVDHGWKPIGKNEAMTTTTRDLLARFDKLSKTISSGNKVKVRSLTKQIEQLSFADIAELLAAIGENVNYQLQNSGYEQKGVRVEKLLSQASSILKTASNDTFSIKM